jgi:transcriptional regulator with XRE-family HTH domain
MPIVEQKSDNSQGPSVIVLERGATGDEAGTRERPPIGELLRELRGERTLRQVEIDTGVSNSYLCNLESGLKRPGIKTLTKLAAYYRAPILDLLQAAGLQPEGTALQYEASAADVQRSYEFVLADPNFRQFQKPSQSPPPLDFQRFLVQVYEHYTGKKLL